MDQEKSPARPRVALFVTCIVDLFRPSVGFAAVDLLRAAGCEVVVPESQTCCGQPAYNSGARNAAMAIAERTLDILEPFDHVVVPSGSCAAMIRCHYPELLAGRPEVKARAEVLAAKTHELTMFLHDVMQRDIGMVAYAGSATYHDSCSGLRELGIAAQPRALLAQIDGLELTEAADTDNCCGFGGTFCVKYSDVSTGMADKKLERLGDTGADLVLGGDLGCLMQLAGRARRQAKPLHFRHVAEVLAGQVDTPPIAEAED